MTPAVGQHQSSASASGIAMVGAVVTMLGNFAIAYLVVKDSVEFGGLFLTAVATVTIAGTATALGTNTALVYFMPQALADGGTNTRSLVMTAVRVVGPLSAAVGLGLFVLAPSFASLYRISGTEADQFATLLRIMSPGVAAWALTASLLGATRGLGSMTPTVAISQIFRPGSQTIALAAVLLGVSTPSASQTALAWVVPVIVGALLTVASVRQMGGFESSGQAAVVPRGEFWEFTRPRSVSQALQIGLEKLDVILITALLGTGLAGIYGTVSRFATAGNFLIFSVAQAVSPNLRKTIASQNWDSARLQLRQATSWMVMIAWPYFLVVAIKSEALAGLFNKPELLDGTNALTVLGLGMMASAAAGPVDLALLMLGKSRASLLGSALAFATDIVLLLLLAKPLGLVGAALAWAGAVAVQNGVATVLAHRHGNLFGPGKPSLVAAAGAIVAVVPIAFLTPQNFTGLAIVAGVAIPILLGWTYFNRELFGLTELGRGAT